MTYDRSEDRDGEQVALLSSKVKPTPLPVGKLAILCLVRLSEPIGYTVIFPFVNEMMEHLHVTDDPGKVGFYSGIVDSIFAVAQLFTIYQWSALSDRIGRKPVIMIGLFGAALSSLCFGLSYNFATTVIARALAGMLSGNAAVVSSMLGEMTDETNQAGAFPVLGASWSAGCILGPLIGASLSYPATRYPEYFGGYAFLHQYPYFLPCFVSAFITIFSIILCLVFVDETLPSIVNARRRKAQGIERRPSNASGASYGSMNSANIERKEDPSKKIPSAWELLSLPAIQSILLSGYMLFFLAIGFDVVFVLYCFSPVEYGGLARSPVQIGYALAGSGLLSTVMSLLIFPALQKRFNNQKMYRNLMALWPVIFIVMPVLNYLVRIGAGPAVIWLGIAMILIPVRIAGLNFPLNMMLVKAASPCDDAVGCTFGLQQTVACLGRATGPAFASSMFAISVDKHLMGDHLVWVTLAALGCLGTYWARDSADLRPKYVVDDEETMQQAR